MVGFQTGFVANPLRGGKYRNMICVCGSEKKVKKCCGVWFSVKPDVKESIINVLKARGDIECSEEEKSHAIHLLKKSADKVLKERELAESKRSEDTKATPEERTTEASS